MKKLVSLIIAMILVLSAAAYAEAAVPSKTTTDNTVVEKVETSTGVVVEETFAIVVTPDPEPVVKEITNLYQYVVEEQKAPITYFPEETKTKVLEVLAVKLAGVEKVEEIEDIEAIENLPDLEQMEINEFITVETFDYKEEYGDIKTNFVFVTEYKAEQQVVVLFGLYTGEVDENGEFIVEWIVLDATVEEDGSLTVVIPQEEMLKMQEAQSVAMAVLSEKLEGDAEELAEQAGLITENE